MGELPNEAIAPVCIHLKSQISDLRWARSRSRRCRRTKHRHKFFKTKPSLSARFNVPGSRFKVFRNYETKPMNALAPATPGGLKSALQSKNYQTNPSLGAQFKVPNELASIWWTG